MRRKNPDWRRYEEAVARFIKAIDPSATVLHDVRRPDSDTGSRRQRDVWVEAQVGGLLRVKILVSCKRLRRRVNEQDLDALFGEIRSAGAHMGAIFANSGFTKPALLKAQKIGITCCRLFDSEPADIPSILPMQIYLCVPTVDVEWFTPPGPEWGFSTFADVLTFELEYQGQMASMDKYVAAAMSSFHAESMRHESDRYAFPKDVRRVLAIRDDEKGYSEFALRLTLRWRVFRASAAANLLNGAYSYTDGTFIGDQLPPWAPLHDAEPGNAWEELDERPDTRGTCGITEIRPLYNVSQKLRARLGATPIEDIPCRRGA